MQLNVKNSENLLHEQKSFFQTQPLLSNLTVLTLDRENEVEEQ